MSRKHLFLYFLFFVFLWGTCIPASNALGKTPPKPIRLEMNKSVVFHLPQPAIRVSIANPGIADVTLITPRQVFIVAKEKLGATNLIVWYDEDQASAFDVEIYISKYFLSLVQKALKEHAPCACVNASMGANSLVLDGYVPDQETMKRVLEVAQSYVKQVTNLIRVRSMIEQAIKESLPEKSLANLTVTMTEEGIVLDGTVDSQETLMRALTTAKTFSPSITNQVQVQGPQQVQIEVTIAEVSRSTMRRLGLSTLFDWQGKNIGIFTPGSTSSAESDMGSVSGEGTSLEDMARQLWASNLENVFSAGAVSSSYGSAFQLMMRNSDGIGILNILKGQGLARTLATPTLVTLNGQEAEFLVGGEIPYVTWDEIIFRNFGVQLKFTPFVTGKETITLKVEPEVSSPDYSFDPPGLKSRRASTVIQLKDGQTFVMAGLLNEDVSRIANKLPFLGDIPILGSLFSSKQFKRSESELVIIATPRLVRALNPGEVPPLPGADIDMDTNDTDFFLLNGKKLSPAQQGCQAEAAPLPCGATGFAR